MKRPLLPAAHAAEGIGDLGRGALRPLAFDPAQHKLLCEELKHLYTAITRAKNSVIIFDDNPTARAPFYYFLTRLGLGKLVVRGLMEEGVDTHELGLTKTRSTPQDWAQRGNNLLENGMFDGAAMCFERAGDLARAEYCQLRGKLNRARLMQEEDVGEARQLWFSAAYELLALAVNAQPDPSLPPTITATSKRGQPRPGSQLSTLEKERRLWVQLAGRAFQSAGERDLAVRTFMELGLFKQSRQLLVQIGDAARLAACCETAAGVLERQGKPDVALQWLAEAIKQYRAVQQYSKCLELMEGHPDVMLPLKRKHAELVQDVALHGMASRHAKKDHAGAVAASRLLTDQNVRTLRLQQYGYWEELARCSDDPVFVARWQAETAGLAVAADKLLPALLQQAAGAAAANRASASSAEKLLRLTHKYVVAAGTPQQAQQLWDALVARAAAGQQADPAMQADVALRVAHQAAGLHPGTGLQLPADEAAAAVAAALEVAEYLAAAVRPETSQDPSSSGEGSGRSSSEAPQALAAELAMYSLGVYQAGGNTLGVLRCVAMLCHVAGVLTQQQRRELANPLQHLLDAARLLFQAVLGASARPPSGRAPGVPAAAQSPEEREALAQLERALGLTGLTKAGSVMVSCAKHDPRFSALAAAFNQGAAPVPAAQRGQPGKGGSLDPKSRQQAEMPQPGGAPSMPSTVLECEARAARQAVAWWVHRLTTSALIRHLRQLSSSGSNDAAPALSDLPSIMAVVEAAKDGLRLLARLTDFHVDCRQQLPVLAPQRSAGSYLAAATRAGGEESSLLQELRVLEGQLFGRLAALVFPTAVVDEAAPTLLPTFLVAAHLNGKPKAVDPNRFADWVKATFQSRSLEDKLGNPNVGFDVWRQLTVLIGYTKRCHQTLKQDVSSIWGSIKPGSQAHSLLVKVSKREHPAFLLVEAIDRLREGLIYRGCDAMLFYLERTWAVAEVLWDSPPAANNRAATKTDASAAPAAGASAPAGLALLLQNPDGKQGPQLVTPALPAVPSAPPGLPPPPAAAAAPQRGSTSGSASGSGSSSTAGRSPSFPVSHLSPERCCWLLELLAGFGSLACLDAGGYTKPTPCIFLSQPSAELLQALPFVDSELAELAEKLHSSVKPEQLHVMWSRLASLLASTVQRLGAVLAAGGRRSSSSGIGSVEEAQCVVGRLALAAGSLLASLSIHSNFGQHKGVPDEVPGALYCCLEAAGRAVPSLAPHTEQLQKEQRVGRLVHSLKALADQLGTHIMQVQPPEKKGKGKVLEFDAFPKQGAGALAQLPNKPVAFRQKALKAAPTSVHMPALQDVQEYAPGSSPEERRAKAAFVIRQHWRQYKERQRLLKQGRAERAAIRFLRSHLPFRWGVLCWLLKARVEAKKLEKQRQRQQEVLKQRELVISGKGPLEIRYSWQEPLLQLGPLAPGERCPVCPRHAIAPPPGLTSPSRGPGSRLSVHAREFKPHLLTDEHARQLEAFRQWKQLYEAQVAPQLQMADMLRPQLDMVAQANSMVELPVAKLHAALQPAYHAVFTVLLSCEATFAWADVDPMVEALQRLSAAVVQAQAWLHNYHVAAAAQQQAWMAAQQQGVAGAMPIIMPVMPGMGFAGGAAPGGAGLEFALPEALLQQQEEEGDPLYEGDRFDDVDDWVEVPKRGKQDRAGQRQGTGRSANGGGQRRGRR